MGKEEGRISNSRVEGRLTFMKVEISRKMAAPAAGFGCGVGIFGGWGKCDVF